MGRTYCCSPETFVPKEQTEIVVDVALDLIRKRQEEETNLTIIDMATGCGIIAISLALSFDNAELLASDISPAAIDSAQRNLDKFSLRNRVHLFCGDLFVPFFGLGYEQRIDAVVCNPPYIPTGSLSKLPSAVLDFEPRVALDGGPFGIDFHRRLINDSLSMLKPKGILIFEIGIGQEELISRLFRGKETYGNVQYHGRQGQIRVVSAMRK